jgi:sulfatase modifying factor 1
MDSAKGCCVPARAGKGPSPDELRAFARRTGGPTGGMHRLAGGEFRMGTDGTYGFASDGEGPAHAVKLQPFWLDAVCVTNEQFNEFVNATGYKTDSERFGWSFVFYGHLTPHQQATTARSRVLGTEWWCQVPGAAWRHPEGPGTTIKQRWNFPVVHVSWTDAATYAAWRGKRLPTEAEWEYGARGGLVDQRFPWGEELEPAGRHRMNVWQGNFPVENTAADGYAGVAPAKSFPANGFGLYNMTGNVWEWCWDWFDPEYYRRSPAEDPLGPEQGERRVMRGGSYLCHASYCNRYRTDARSSNTPDSAASNIGFRCAAG